MPRRPWVTASGRNGQNQVRSALIWSKWRLVMHRSSESVAAIATALAKAQTELSNPEKAMVGTVYSARSDNRHRSGQRHGQPDHHPPAHLGGVDLLGLAGLPIIRDIGTPSDGGCTDLRPTLRTVYDGGDRWRGRSRRAGFCQRPAKWRQGRGGASRVDLRS